MKWILQKGDLVINLEGDKCRVEECLGNPDDPLVEYIVKDLKYNYITSIPREDLILVSEKLEKLKLRIDEIQVEYQQLVKEYGDLMSETVEEE